MPTTSPPSSQTQPKPPTHPSPSPPSPSPSHASKFNKPCTLCATPRPVLVRCQIDPSQTWHFVCPGPCWRSVSGGQPDARGHEDEFPYYRYGGMWKNKHAGVSAKMKKGKRKGRKERGGGVGEVKGLLTGDDEVASGDEEGGGEEEQEEEGEGENHGGREGGPNAGRVWREDGNFTRNDRVWLEDRVWICRRSHAGGSNTKPTDARGYRYWKEDDHQE